MSASPEHKEKEQHSTPMKKKEEHKYSTLAQFTPPSTISPHRFKKEAPEERKKYKVRSEATSPTSSIERSPPQLKRGFSSIGQRTGEERKIGVYEQGTFSEKTLHLFSPQIFISQRYKRYLSSETKIDLYQCVKKDKISQSPVKRTHFDILGTKLTHSNSNSNSSPPKVISPIDNKQILEASPFHKPQITAMNKQISGRLLRKNYTSDNVIGFSKEQTNKNISNRKYLMDINSDKYIQEQRSSSEYSTKNPNHADSITVKDYENIKFASNQHKSGSLKYFDNSLTELVKERSPENFQLQALLTIKNVVQGIQFHNKDLSFQKLKFNKRKSSQVKEAKIFIFHSIMKGIQKQMRVRGERNYFIYWRDMAKKGKEIKLRQWIEGIKRQKKGKAKKVHFLVKIFKIIKRKINLTTKAALRELREYSRESEIQEKLGRCVEIKMKSMGRNGVKRLNDRFYIWLFGSVKWNRISHNTQNIMKLLQNTQNSYSLYQKRYSMNCIAKHKLKVLPEYEINNLAKILNTIQELAKIRKTRIFFTRYKHAIHTENKLLQLKQNKKLKYFKLLKLNIVKSKAVKQINKIVMQFQRRVDYRKMEEILNYWNDQAKIEIVKNNQNNENLDTKERKTTSKIIKCKQILNPIFNQKLKLNYFKTWNYIMSKEKEIEIKCKKFLLILMNIRHKIEKSDEKYFFQQLTMNVKENSKRRILNRIIVSLERPNSRIMQEKRNKFFYIWNFHSQYLLEIGRTYNKLVNILEDVQNNRNIRYLSSGLESIQEFAYYSLNEERLHQFITLINKTYSSVSSRRKENSFKRWQNTVFKKKDLEQRIKPFLIRIIKYRNVINLRCSSYFWKKISNYSEECATRYKLSALFRALQPVFTKHRTQTQSLVLNILKARKSYSFSNQEEVKLADNSVIVTKEAPIERLSEVIERFKKKQRMRKGFQIMRRDKREKEWNVMEEEKHTGPHKLPRHRSSANLNKTATKTTLLFGKIKRESLI